MKPLLWPSEISSIEELLLSAARRSGRVDVLEWGSGGSTVFFTRFMRERRIPYTWTSIEYNARWAGKVREALQGDQNATVVLFDVGNEHVLQRKTPMEEYIAYPSTMGKKFDFIFVDGRKRRRCLIAAHGLLKVGGVALLHDAERRYYWSAFSAYPRGYFASPRFFIGLIGVPTLGERVRHVSTFALPLTYRAIVLLWRLKQRALGRPL